MSARGRHGFNRMQASASGKLIGWRSGKVAVKSLVLAGVRQPPSKAHIPAGNACTCVDCRNSGRVQPAPLTPPGAPPARQQNPPAGAEASVSGRTRPKPGGNTAPHPPRRCAVRSRGGCGRGAAQRLCPTLAPPREKDRGNSISLLAELRGCFFCQAVVILWRVARVRDPAPARWGARCGTVAATSAGGREKMREYK